MHKIVQRVSTYLSGLPWLRPGIHARIEWNNNRFIISVRCMDPVSSTGRPGGISINIMLTIYCLSATKASLFPLGLMDSRVIFEMPCEEKSYKGTHSG